MSFELNNLRLEQIQTTVNAYAVLRTKRTPPRGWLKEVREALGRTERQQAERLNIASSTLHKSEQSEADERISLGQLRKLADALDCELVYALIPRMPLPQVVQEQAEKLAKAEVFGVAHTMALEDQKPADERIQKQVTRRAEELLRGKWSDLWR